MKTKFACLIGASILIAAGCDRTGVTDPVADDVEAPRFSSITTATLEAPNPSVNGGEIPQRVVGAVGVRKWASVRVAGRVFLDKNPASCGTNIPSVSAGPKGIPTAYINLKVYVSRAYNNLGFTLTGDGDASEVTSNIIFNPGSAPENIKAWRNGGVGASRGCYPVGTVYDWVGSGSQTVTLEELPDPTIEATKTHIAAQDTVQFVGANIPSGFNSMWFWMANDTGAVNNPDFGGVEITGCRTKRSCAHAPATSGRMYLRFGTGTGGTVGYPGPVVWVGRTPSAALTMSCTAELWFRPARRRIAPPELLRPGSLYRSNDGMKWAIP